MNFSSKTSEVLLLGASSLFGSAFSKILKSKKIKFDVISKSTPSQKDYNNFLKCNFENDLPVSKINDFLLKNDNKYKLIVFFNGIQGPKKKLNSLSNKDFNKILNINCFSLIKMFSIIESNNKIAKNALIIFFSSRAGSISERGTLDHHIPGGDNIYRVSKSALNSYIKNISYEFIDKNFKIIAYHPGWLVRNKSKNSFDKDYKYYMNSFLKILKNKSLKNGNFYNFDGNTIPW